MTHAINEYLHNDINPISNSMEKEGKTVNSFFKGKVCNFCAISSKQNCKTCNCFKTISVNPY